MPITIARGSERIFLHGQLCYLLGHATMRRVSMELDEWELFTDDLAGILLRLYGKRFDPEPRTAEDVNKILRSLKLPYHVTETPLDYAPGMNSYTVESYHDQYFMGMKDFQKLPAEQHTTRFFKNVKRSINRRMI